MGHFFEVLLAESGMDVVDVARRSGVSRSTIYRLLRGEVDPRISTIREIAIACGRDLDVMFGPINDPRAIEGARLLYEAGYVPADRASAAAWSTRIERVSAGDPVTGVEFAGSSAPLAGRAGTYFHRGAVTALRVASAGSAARAPWALSGAPMLDREGVIVLHSAAPQLASDLLRESAPRVDEAAGASVIIVPASESTFHDVWEEGPLRFVAPIQMVLDSVALGGELREAALAEAREW